MPNIILTNMVMIQDMATGKVVVQDRVNRWSGLAFPGGHVLDGESIVDSAIREVKEETGLDVKNLKACGMMHWSSDKTFDRYFSFLFKTVDYSGELIKETKEGKVFWIDAENLKKSELSENFEDFLPMFFEDKYSEAFGLWDEDEFSKIVYK